jgi:hypothetical protein
MLPRSRTACVTRSWRSKPRRTTERSRKAPFLFAAIVWSQTALACVCAKACDNWLICGNAWRVEGRTLM